MNTSRERTSPLGQKKRSLLAIRIAGLVVLLAAAAMLWNNLPVLGTVAAVVLLLVVTCLYLVEARYSRALERALGTVAGRETSAS